MNGKHVIVTGANSGLGKITARELAKLGAKVTLVCRDERRGRAALEEIRTETGNQNLELLVCDFASQRSIREAADKFRATHDRLDVLVNNAGGVLGERRLTGEGIEATFAINHLGYFLFTNELLDLLKRSAPSRIVNVASEAHRGAHLDFENLRGEKSYSGFRAYGASKLANIAFTIELARRLEGTGVTVNACHPGVVASNFGSGGGALFRFGVRLARPFMLSEEAGARTQIYLATSPEVEGVTGKYFKRQRPAKPAAEALDPRVQERLWEVSERLTATA